MGAETGIAWTDHSFNPWWGCQRVSPGCTNCYAEAWDKHRGGKSGPHWGPQAPRRFFSDKHWNEPLKWNRLAQEAGVRRRVFCASMADVFEDRRDLDAQRERLWKLIGDTPDLDWQLLTKRPENIRRLLPSEWDQRNVWLGTTVEDQQRADERIPHLLKVPAAVRFLSCEPLLESVDLTRLYGKVQIGESVDLCVDALRGLYVAAWTGRRSKPAYPLSRAAASAGPVNWVIVGGESGHGARPMQLEWARALVQQCKAAGVATFVKQLGAKPQVNYYDEQARNLFDEKGYDWPDPEGWSEGDGQPRPGALVSLGNRRGDPKGGNIEEWPEELRVREFPRSAP